MLTEIVPSIEVAESALAEAPSNVAAGDAGDENASVTPADAVLWLH